MISASFLETLKERGRARLVKASLSVKKLIALATSYLNLRQQENRITAITLARMLPDEAERSAILNAAQLQILALMGVKALPQAEVT